MLASFISGATAELLCRPNQLWRALLDMLQTLMRLAIDLLCEGFFVCGAIVKGPLYDDDHMVFERPTILVVG
jgi:hypothetical protein